MSLKILWYPKLYQEILQDNRKIYATSTRMRVCNFHQGIKNLPGVESHILGLDMQEFRPWNYDVLVIQKTIPAGKLAFKLCLWPELFVVQDLCDPIKPKVIQDIHRYADLVITSNHELSLDVLDKGAKVPVQTVLDNHDANPDRVKQHVAKDRLRVTWYGIGDNYFHFIKPMRSVFDQDFLDFRWASGDDPRWNSEWGFERGVQMELSQEESWHRKDSWQEFIFATDIGVVPVMEHIKSPHKILNYMAYGIPVICTPTDAHSRIVKHGINGFLASTNREWNQYLTALKDPELRTKMGLEARQTALKQYSLTNISHEYLKTIQTHLSQKRRPFTALTDRVNYALSHLRQSSVAP